MKVYTLLILFSFFKILLCDIEGLIINKLNNIFAKSLPYLKVFHPESFTIRSTSMLLGSSKFQYDEINKNNIIFKLDEFNGLHVKFVHLKATMSGLYRTDTVRNLSPYKKFKANLNDITYEQTYKIITTKQPNGKYSFKYTKIGESDLSFNVEKFDIPDYDGKKLDLLVKMASSSLKSLNYNAFKLHLNKLQNLILDLVASELQK